MSEYLYTGSVFLAFVAGVCSVSGRHVVAIICLSVALITMIELRARHRRHGSSEHPSP